MNLDVIKLVDTQNTRDEEFFSKMESNLKLDMKKNKIISNEDWLDEVEFTIPYIEKALRNPNKNIVTEEEIIKIELIKKVSVESIKHLSKHTNFIDQYDQKTGDVIPAKILNAYKEESFITYENRFIYTLIKMIEDFIYLRTKAGEQEFKGKNKQTAMYEAKTKLRKERIKLNFEYSSELAESLKKDENSMVRIKQLQNSLKMLKATEMYQLLDGKKVTLVKAPLKMTNVLLKNVNFQYAVKLWNYLSDQLDMEEKSITQKRSITDEGLTKKLVDEDFYLCYLIFNVLNKQVKDGNNSKRTELDRNEKEDITNKLIENIIEINPEMAEQELKRLIVDRYVVLKNKEVISLKPLERKFKEKINQYLTRVKELRLK